MSAGATVDRDGGSGPVDHDRHHIVHPEIGGISLADMICCSGSAAGGILT